MRPQLVPRRRRAVLDSSSDGGDADTAPGESAAFDDGIDSMRSRLDNLSLDSSRAGSDESEFESSFVVDDSEEEIDGASPGRDLSASEHSTTPESGGERGKPGVVIATRPPIVEARASSTNLSASVRTRTTEAAFNEFNERVFRGTLPVRCRLHCMCAPCTGLRHRLTFINQSLPSSVQRVRMTLRSLGTTNSGRPLALRTQVGICKTVAASTKPASSFPPRCWSQRSVFDL